MWGKFVKILEWIGHGNTALQVAGWIGFPTAWFTGFAVTFFSSAVEGWSVTAVWIASVATGAILAMLYAALMIGFAYHRYALSAQPALAKQQTARAAHRPIPVTPDSLYSFLNGYQIVRETDQAIASDLGLQIEEDHFPVEALASAVRHFGIASLSDLETLLREHQEIVIELSRYFRPKGSGSKPAKLTRGHSVLMLLEMLAARTDSVDAYMDYAKAIGAICGRDFAKNVIDAYRQIAPQTA